jgi:hypothetical protein
MTLNFTDRKFKLVAAGLVIAYILIQCFQEYVFRTIPPPTNVAEELFQGAMPLHRWRSILLLLSFFGLMYAFFVISLHNFKRNAMLSLIAFVGFFIFCSLEIGIRSVEFFYTQIQLPELLLQAKEDALKNSIIDKYSVFQSIQMSLYFPLMIAQGIASVILLGAFSDKSKINLLIKIAFGLNAFRLATRLFAMTFHVNWFDSFGGDLYLPFVIAIYGLIAIWLLKAKEENSTT